ncbi:MAG: CCA tRNA nucleotidyltransferase [Lachnospiraceae bacterium]|nr:CCA tRNA nucleotidyltransferase [Lachnospiraceae bacterium]
MKMILPEQVTNIIETLQNNGHEAYAVGGCVRDLYLGKTPADWDITTSASPGQVKSLFSHTIDTGIIHGTVTVMMGKNGYEVTTYRVDGEYKDGRHPEQVMFTSLLSEDLCRRDFTINAMAYNEQQGLVDLFGGLEDLKKGVIRCVGNPRERFSEDALRMLRALRLSAQLGFEIEPNTYHAICELAPTIEKVSMERIMVELNKLLMSEHPDRMRMVYETGLTRVFLPEFDAMMKTPQNNKHHCYSVGEHTLHSLEHVPPDKTLRLAMLFHDVGKPATRTTDEKGQDHFYGHQEVGAEMTGDILRRLKYDNDTIATVKRFVRFHDERPKIDRPVIRKTIARIGISCFPELFVIKRADTLAQSDYRRRDKLQQIRDFETVFGEIMEAGECVEKKNLCISGRDIMNLGVAQGSMVGDLLDVLFQEVLEHPERNTPKQLLTMAEERIKKGNIPKRKPVE